MPRAFHALAALALLLFAACPEEEVVGPPEAPTSLVASASSATAIHLTWSEASEDVTGFKLQRSADAATWEDLATPEAAARAYDDKKLAESRRYYYRLAATGPGGDSDWSNVASATTGVLQPAAPSELTATATSTSAIHLAWKDNSTTETGFRIERSPDGTTNWEFAGSAAADATAWDDSGLPAGTSRSYRVLATGAITDSDWSNVAKARTLGNPPAAPSELAASATSTSEIDLTWKDNASTESGFEVERSPDDGASWAQVATPAADVTSWGDSGLSPGTRYSYRVRATNSSGSSEWSNVASATTVSSGPAAPSGLSAAATSSSAIHLAWTDNSDDETGFEVERSSDGSSDWAQVGTPGAGETAFDDAGLAASTQYFYRVRAVSAAGSSAWSNTADATTSSGLPAAPSGLAAAATSTTAIHLDWTDNSGDETGFEVERSPDGSTGWAQIATPAADATSLDDTGLAPSTTYHYRVRAVNVLGASAWSDPASATTGVPPPSAPTDLTAAATSTSAIHLTWTDNATTESGFEIERSPDGTTGWSQQATPGANAVSWDDSGLSAGTSYSYRVRAVSAAGSSGWSNVASATTQVAVPGAPSALSAAATSSSAIHLAWTDNASNETGFEVERSLTGTGGWSQVGTPAANATAFDDGGLTPATEYFYRVRAVNAGGSSGWSSTASATTQASAPAAPSALSAAATSSDTIHLSWTDNASDETGFEIERSLDGTSGWTQVGTPAANATSYDDSGLDPVTEYFYRVRAVNGGGNSAWTSVASATTLVAVPAAPSDLAASATSATDVHLTWTDNASDETGFEVQRSLDGTSGWTQVGTPAADATSFDDAGLTTATAYYYRVRAVNAGGGSAWSNVASATTP